MSDTKSKQKTFQEAIQDLVHIIANDRGSIDRNDFKLGSESVGIFQDSNFSDSFKNLKELKKQVIHEAIEDLSMGANNLRSGQYGVVFSQNTLTKFLSTHDLPPQGQVIFSIFLKDVVAFKNWRNNEGDELPQDEINSSIYFLVVTLSHLI